MLLYLVAALFALRAAAADAPAPSTQEQWCEALGAPLPAAQLKDGKLEMIQSVGADGLVIAVPFSAIMTVNTALLSPLQVLNADALQIAGPRT